MVDIFLFTPLSTGSLTDNIDKFITKCKSELTVFGSTLAWEAPVWPNIAVFSKLGVTTRKPSHEQVMDVGFRDFAKSYFRYQQGHNPTKGRNELKALRAIEAALLKLTGTAKIDRISFSILDEAAVLASEYYSKGAAYQCGRELERLAKFLADNNMAQASLESWKHPIVRPDDKNRTGKRGKELREKRLPDDVALNTLAEIFSNNPAHPRDIFTTSVFAMLMSAPSRITEVLALPVHCEIREKDRDGDERYGWRFYANKGFESDIKWIPTTMSTVAAEAIRRLTRLSANARRLATWAEENPTKFYRHSNCPNVRDDALLSMAQVCQALGLAYSTKKLCTTSLNNRKLITQDGVYTLNDLWKYVVSRLPEDFPWYDRDKGIKFSEALCALNANQLHGNRACSPVELHKPSHNFFNNDLSPRVSLTNGSHRSIFDRHGYRSESGAALKLTSHQPRHLLNTVAQRGGLSNLEIAKWSGRASVQQNRTYNHMSDYELVGLAESIDPSKSLYGPSGAVESHIPVTSLEFNTLDRAAAHVTEYGYCVHDYTISPCEKYRDCINCTEQVCIKGDFKNLLRIKERLERTEQLYETAKLALEQGEIGADRWYQYHEKTVFRLRDLVSILEDPKIENGSQVKLRGNDFSQLRRVIGKKAAEAIESKSAEAAMLADMRDLLGGGLG